MKAKCCQKVTSNSRTRETTVPLYVVLETTPRILGSVVGPSVQEGC